MVAVKAMEGGILRIRQHYSRLVWTPSVEGVEKVPGQADQDGNHDIYVMDTDGGNLKQVTFTDYPVRNQHPKWSGK